MFYYWYIINYNNVIVIYNIKLIKIIIEKHDKIALKKDHRKIML